MDYFVVNTLHSVFASDALETTRPMTHYVESPGAISGLFDNIAYEKCKYNLQQSLKCIKLRGFLFLQTAGSVLRMFLNAFTESTFKKGLKIYLTTKYAVKKTVSHINSLIFSF